MDLVWDERRHGDIRASGIPITMDYELVDGAVKWDVTCMQSLAGGDPTAGIAQLFSDYLDFTYPGRAKPFTATFPLHTVGTGYIYDVYKSPPIGVKVEATVKITYQTGDTIGALDYPLWNPTEWAALRAFCTKAPMATPRPRSRASTATLPWARRCSGRPRVP